MAGIFSSHSNVILLHFEATKQSSVPQVLYHIDSIIPLVL